MCRISSSDASTRVCVRGFPAPRHGSWHAPLRVRKANQRRLESCRSKIPRRSQRDVVRPSPPQALRAFSQAHLSVRRVGAKARRFRRAFFVRHLRRWILHPARRVVFHFVFIHFYFLRPFRMHLQPLPPMRLHDSCVMQEVRSCRAGSRPAVGRDTPQM